MKIFSALTLVLILAVTASAATIYVPDDFAMIQDAIDAAVNGDTVLVRAGTYVENLDFVGKEITLMSEFGPANTIIEGNQSGYCVAFTSGEGLSTVLEGFTITNGDGAYGAGIYCEASSPTISNNFITYNGATFGGGICCKQKACPDIVGNWIHLNRGSNGGGGIYCNDSSPSIRNNRVSKNYCIYTATGSLRHEDSGGGIQCRNHSNPVIFNNLIIKNRANYGGGIYCETSTPLINGNTIAKNIADYCGGLAVDGALLFAENNIFWNDEVTTNDAEIWIENSAVTISYSDVRGGLSGIYLGQNASVDWGDGNIDADPLFEDVENYDFHLRQPPCEPVAFNPCVDAANPTWSVVEGSTRTDGAQDSGRLDMGYHYPFIGDGIEVLVPADYPTIQDAINQSSDGDTITVQPGTYYENIDFIGRLVTLRSELGPESTILDGNQSGSVITLVHHETRFAVIEGFTITNGGCGIHCDDSSPIIRNNVVRNNVIVEPDWNGGGIVGHGFDPTIINNIIEHNEAHSGGGLFVISGTPLVKDNIIRHNSANSGGGILCHSYSRPTISNNLILSNHVLDQGGGIRCSSDSTPTIEWNSITNNTASGGHGLGAGIDLNSCTNALVRNNVLSGNVASDGGGGLAIRSSTDDVIVNNMIVDNEAARGGAVFITGCDSTPSLRNNTLANNRALLQGGGIMSTGHSSGAVFNSILWNNSAPEGKEICVGDSAWPPTTLAIEYSDIEGGIDSCHIESGCTFNWGEGMIDADPLFVDAAGGDFHLTFDSACRDAGNDMTVDETIDFEGDPRIALDTVDMGADEFYYHLYTVGDVVPGGALIVRVVGRPNWTVRLASGSGVREEPLPTAYGDFFLEAPIDIFRLGRISQNGVFDFPATVPPSWQPGEIHPFQALVGEFGWSNSRLTNLMILKAD